MQYPVYSRIIIIISIYYDLLGLMEAFTSNLKHYYPWPELVALCQLVYLQGGRRQSCTPCPGEAGMSKEAVDRQTVCSGCASTFLLAQNPISLPCPMLVPKYYLQLARAETSSAFRVSSYWALDLTYYMFVNSNSYFSE